MSTRIERERAQLVLPWGAAQIGRQLRPDDASARATLLDPSDPILQHLSTDPIREYWRIGLEATVAASWRQLTTALRAYDLELLPASSRADRGRRPTRAQRRVHEALLAGVDRIPMWPTVLDRALDACAWGWRPFEITYRRDARAMGETYWRPAEIADLDVWHFRFNALGSPVLVTLGGNQVLDQEGDAYRWWMPRSGSTACPYGIGLFQGVWLSVYLRRKFLERWSSALQRIGGVYKVKQAPAGAVSLTRPTERAEVGRSVEEIAQEARRVLSVLEQSGILVEGARITGEFIEGMLTDASSFQQAVDYFDQLIRRCLLGQDLTGAAAKDTSSRSANETARKAMLDVARHLGEQLEQILDGFALILARINFGEDVDPGDVPYWRSGIRRNPQLEAARALYDMGAVIDGAALAEDAGIRLAEPGAEGALQKQAAPALDPLSTPPGPGQTDPSPADPSQDKPPNDSENVPI